MYAMCYKNQPLKCPKSEIRSHVSIQLALQLQSFIIYLYSNPSVYEQSVYKFSLVLDAQITTRFSIYEPVFTCMSSFLSQTDRCSRCLF
jgi:hypothetical protein